MIRKNSDERGTVLLGVLLGSHILTLLGLVSMNLATQEVVPKYPRIKMKRLRGI